MLSGFKDLLQIKYKLQDVWNIRGVYQQFAIVLWKFQLRKIIWFEMNWETDSSRWTYEQFIYQNQIRKHIILSKVQSKNHKVDQHVKKL